MEGGRKRRIGEREGGREGEEIGGRALGRHRQRVSEFSIDVFYFYT